MPKASIITAAYNRSNVLYYAIESVRRQTCSDWEHIIVGDHCTDDTEAVVSQFRDPRIRFVNLPQNTGGQSAPHNLGLSMAKGQYLFFLNQDDFYFPDHIASSIAYLERCGADLIWSPVAIPVVTNRNAEDWRDQPILVDGVTERGYFDASVFIISSSWAFQASATDRMGPWKPANETTVSPSQELLFRAWKTGCDIQFHPHISVLCIHSGSRRNAYATREWAETQRYFDLVYSDANGRAKLMERITLTMAITPRAHPKLNLTAALRNVRDLLILKASSSIGIHPNAFDTYFRYRSDGGLISWHRKQVLGAPAVRKGEVIRIGHNAADRFLGFGWSVGEGVHRWSENRHAQVSFRMDEDMRPDKVLITGRPIVPQTVEFRVVGQSPVRHAYGEAIETIEVPLSSNAEITSLTIAVAKTIRPRGHLPGSADERTLGFSLVKLEFS